MEAINGRNDKRIGIVGVGVSGLLVWKCAISKRHKPVVFEASNMIGGMWTTTLETTKLQMPQEYYRFSDFPWPAKVSEEFPRHDQVLDYLWSYADAFRLVKHILFYSKVVADDYRSVGGEEEMEGWHY